MWALEAGEDHGGWEGPRPTDRRQLLPGVSKWGGGHRGLGVPDLLFNTQKP